MFDRMPERCRILPLIVYSAGPAIINDMVDRSNAGVAVWLTGRKATELSDLPLGSSEFEGHLTQPRPASAGELDPGSSRSRIRIQDGLGGERREAST